MDEDFKILEIGACYGYFSIILSKLLNGKGQIISIECLPRNYEILNNNLSLNNINNVETLNYFISSQNEANVFFEKNVRNPYALIKRLKNNINLNNEIKNSSKFDGVKSISISNLLNSLNFNPTLVRQLWDRAKKLNLKAFKGVVGLAIYDDHVPLFQYANIPSIDIIDFRYPNSFKNYWHTVEDTPKNCSPESLGQVGTLMVDYIFNRKFYSTK